MVDLSPTSLQYLQNAVTAGVYPNAQTALDEAVELLKRRDSLKADVLAGIEQADRGELIPGDEVFDRIEARIRAREEAL